MHVPHNRMHAILKSKGLAIDEPKKQRRRRHVTYERPRSMDLWHADCPWACKGAPPFRAVQGDGVCVHDCALRRFSSLSTRTTILSFMSLNHTSSSRQYALFRLILPGAFRNPSFLRRPGRESKNPAMSLYVTRRLYMSIRRTIAARQCSPGLEPALRLLSSNHF